MKYPANRVDDGFGNYHWNDPGVELSFASTRPPVEVYRYIDKKARAAGWKPYAKGEFYITDDWVKVYPDGVNANLGLGLRSSPNAAKRTYSLDSSE